MLMFVLLTTEFERNVFMKGVVFSFKGSSFVRPHFRGLSKSDIKYFCKRYLKHCAFVLLLLVGLAVGAVFAGKADEQLMNSLDFCLLLIFLLVLSRMYSALFVPVLLLISYFSLQFSCSVWHLGESL